MITLYQFEISPFCDKVRRVLHWKKVPYEIVEVPLTRLPFLSDVTPTGKVPALRFEDRIVVDSTDIVRELEKRFPSPSIFPDDPVDRARVHVLEDWADESLYWYELTMRITWANNAATWVPKLAANDPAPIRALAPHLILRVMARATHGQGLGRKPRAQVLEEVRRHLEAVESMVSAGGYLVAGRLTLADIAVYAQLHCIRGTEEGEPLFARFPLVLEWMARVDAETRP